MNLPIGLAACALLALPCAAQEATPSESEVKESLRNLEQSDREALHASEDPLVVVGREQDDNDLRSRTPALTRSDRVAARVDEEDAYARALARYEGTALHTPPRTLAAEGDGGEAPARRRTSARSAAAATQDEESSSAWRSLPVLLGGLLTLGLILRHVLRR